MLDSELGVPTIISFSVVYRHRTWNHICWTFNGNTQEVNFFFNTAVHEKKISPVRFQVFGSNVYKNAFLVFGQDPDRHKSRYDIYQLLAGKISRFNWWDSVLREDYVHSLAACKESGQGNIVSWSKELFEMINAEVLDIDPALLCSSSETWVFFPGRRRLDHATSLCESHGGWIVTPNSQEENSDALKIYKDNLDKCKQEGSTSIGWLGVRYYKQSSHIKKANGDIKMLTYDNFER